MNKLRSTLIAVTAVTVVSVGGAFAAGKDSSEKGVPTSNLSIYSGGFGLGAMMAVNKEFKEECGEAFFQASFANTWQFKEYVALFADVNWFASEYANNIGIDAGMDFLFSTSSVRPFVGFGIGVHYFDRELDKDGKEAGFSDKFGPSATAHLGVAIDVTETVQVRMRVPYRVVMTKTTDQGFGVDVGVMFSSKFKNIQKLNY